MNLFFTLYIMLTLSLSPSIEVRNSEIEEIHIISYDIQITCWDMNIHMLFDVKQSLMPGGSTTISLQIYENGGEESLLYYSPYIKASQIREVGERMVAIADFIESKTKDILK